jgi:hypothetical protein
MRLVNLRPLAWLFARVRDVGDSYVRGMHSKGARYCGNNTTNRYKEVPASIFLGR